MHDDPKPRLVFPDTTVLINFALVDEMECYTKSGVSCVVDACDEVDDLVFVETCARVHRKAQHSIDCVVTVNYSGSLACPCTRHAQHSTITF